MSFDRKFRVLIVDDNPSIHEDFRKILCPTSLAGFDDLDRDMFGIEQSNQPEMPEYEIASAYQGMEAVGIVEKSVEENNPFSVAFVDMRMPPGIDGIETIERMWDHSADMQVVICTAHSDYTWHETIERLGWTDRLLILKKPFDRVEASQLALALSVKYEAERMAKMKIADLRAMVAQRTIELETEIDRRKKVEDTLRQKESGPRFVEEYDSVTGLMNRESVVERLRMMAEDAKDLNFQLSVLFVDVDNFHSIHEKFGQLAGDVALRKVANRLNGILRPNDVIGRYGSEEFVIGLMGCSKENAAEIGQRLISEVSASPISYGSESMKITVSVGVAHSRNEPVECENLLRTADMALFEAKQHAQNCAEIPI